MSATIRFTGDFAALQRFQKQIEKCEDPKILELVNKNLAEEALVLIGEGFDRGGDPYGKHWKAPNNLQITGRIRAYARTAVSPDGFQVASTDKKAIWHHDPKPRKQWGGKALPTRLQVPTRAKGLPSSWRARFVETAEEVLSSVFKR